MAIAIGSGDHRIGEGGPLRRLELRCGLTTVGRQTAALLILAWAPLVVFGLVHEAVTARPDPLLHHVATHVRLLVAAPLFLLLDKWFPALCRQMLELLVRQSFVAEDDHARFAAMLRRAERRSDSWGAEAVLVVLGVGLGAAALFGITPVGGLSIRTGPAISRIWFAGLIFLLFVISQFLALFNFTNMATLAAVKMGNLLESAGLGAIPLLVGFVVVVAVLDLVMTGSIPKWAIFAPVFVPLLMRLDVDPEAVLAAYRVADSPVNAISPLNAYFALIVTFSRKYQADAGVGTLVALMLPYVVAVLAVWIVLLVVWQALGLPWGL